jgi:hypothetical protein
VRSPEKFNVHLCQKVPFVHACFQTSAAPRRKNSDLDEKNALFGLHTQITIRAIRVESIPAHPPLPLITKLSVVILLLHSQSFYLEESFIASKFLLEFYN